MIHPFGKSGARRSPRGARMPGVCRRAAFPVVVLAAAACEQPANLESLPNPAPEILAVQPAVLQADGTDQQLEVVGLGFLDETTAQWDETSVNAVLLDSLRLQVVVPASELSAGGSGMLTLLNPAPGGGSSQPTALDVGFPLPRVTSVSAEDSVITGADSLAIVVLGAAFVADPPSQLLWDGIPVPTRFVSSGRLEGRVPGYLDFAGGAVEVRVRNPEPGGGVSEALTLLRRYPVPRMTAIAPEGLRVGSSRRFFLSGTGFAPDVTMEIDGSPYPVVRQSLTVLRFDVPDSMALRGDSLRLRLTNPAPGGGSADVYTLPVWEYPPILSRLSPEWAEADDGPFTLTLEGAFAPDATVLWGGVPQPADFTPGGWLEVPIGPELLANPGEVEVVAVNPRNGGPSDTLLFTVLPPLVLPDDEFLVERIGGSGLTSTRLNGDASRTIATPDLAFRPDPRPGSDEIAFVRGDSIVVRDFETGAERRLVPAGAIPNLVRETWPRWSPDGAWAYFTAEIGTEPPTVWRIRADGTGAQPIFTSWATRFATPSVSGSKISFSDLGMSLWVYDLGTFETSSLAPRAEIGRWSPDDEWIAYTDPTRRLYVVRSDGSERIGPMPGTYGPVVAWQADGQRLIAVSTSSNTAVLIDPWLEKLDTLPALSGIGSIARWPR